MATLTVAQVKLLRRSVGSDPSDAELQSIYDRVGSLTTTAVEVLETRLADFRANPAQFSVAGEYSQSTAENIKALQSAITALLADGKLEDGVGVHIVRVVQPALRPPR